MKHTVTILTLVALMTLAATSSCKKQSDQQPTAKPQRFDPAIDGVAIRPAETIDAERAAFIIENEEALRRGESVIPDVVVASPAPVAPEPIYSAAEITSPTPTAPAPAATADAGDYTDANDLW